MNCLGQSEEQFSERFQGVIPDRGFTKQLSPFFGIIITFQKYSSSFLKVCLYYHFLSILPLSIYINTSCLYYHFLFTLLQSVPQATMALVVCPSVTVTDTLCVTPSPAAASVYPATPATGAGRVSY